MLALLTILIAEANVSTKFRGWPIEPADHLSNIVEFRLIIEQRQATLILSEKVIGIRLEVILA